MLFVSLWTSYQDQDGEQGEEYETEEQLQARILNAALEFVPLHGWSAEAIAAGAEVRSEPKEGQTWLTPSTISIVFIRFDCYRACKEKLSFKSYWECGRISSTSENKRRSTFLHSLQCIYDHLPSTSVNTEQRIDGFVTWFMFVCWYRHWAYLLLPLVCSRMELVTWSFTLLLSATQSWRRSWLNSTSRSSWARLSVYLCIFFPPFLSLSLNVAWLPKSRT